MPRLKQEYSVAPKERINIVYRPATAGRKQQVELPMKLMVLGDFTGQEDTRSVEDREPIEVNDNNLDDVMADMALRAHFTVPNKAVEGAGEELEVDIDFRQMSDFEPGHVIESVPELRQMLELREALKALKGPLGNVPEMRRKIHEIIQDRDKSDKLMKELGIE